MTVNWVDGGLLNKAAEVQIKLSDIVLDIGCGIRPQSYFVPLVHICCEPHGEYIDYLKKNNQNHNLILIKQTVQEFLYNLPDRSIDSIFMLDFIEHVTKEDGLQIINECNRVARNQIIIFTPLGFLPQIYNENELDGWGLHGTHWQEHKSGWDPTDFDETWEITASKVYHEVVNGKKLENPFGAIWAIKNISSSTEASSIDSLGTIMDESISGQDNLEIQKSILMIYKLIKDTNNQFASSTRNNLETIEKKLTEHELILKKYENNINTLFDARESVLNENFNIKLNEIKKQKQELLINQEELQKIQEELQKNLLYRIYKKINK